MMESNTMIKSILALAGLLMMFGFTASAADQDRGAVLYKMYCTQCHGVTGNGKGINAPSMSVQPRDHTDTKEMSTRTDADLTKVIQHGGPSINKSVLMPVWGGNFTDADVKDLVAHLHTLFDAK